MTALFSIPPTRGLTHSIAFGVCPPSHTPRNLFLGEGVELFIELLFFFLLISEVA